MTQKDLTTEIEQLLIKHENGEISYKDLYFELQKYPVEERDKALALHILASH
jgi:hypothetical protein